MGPSCNTCDIVVAVGRCHARLYTLIRNFPYMYIKYLHNIKLTSGRKFEEKYIRRLLSLTIICMAALTPICAYLDDCSPLVIGYQTGTPKIC